MSGFCEGERTALLALKGVGPGVVRRLEQIGYTDFRTLAGAEAGAICEAVSVMLGNNCWRNAPKARAAVAAAIALARAETEAKPVTVKT